MTRTIRRFALPLLTAAVAALPAAAMADNGVHFNDPYIPEAPPVAQSLAGYMQVMNHSDEDRVLVGASSPDFSNPMIHDIEHDGGMARMVHLDALEVPAGEAVSFEPGGLHLMLVGPQRKLAEGDKVEVTLIFADGTRTPVRFPVVSGESMKGGEHNHHHH